MPTFSWGVPLYTDVSFGTTTATSLPVTSSPIPAFAEGYLLTQEFEVFLRNRTAGVLNTLHPDFNHANTGGSDFLLVAEGPRQDIGGGVVKWQRTYAAKPPSHTETESFAYSFIGFTGVYTLGNGIAVNVTGRPRMTRLVSTRLLHEYFLVGTAGGGLASPDYADSQDIPVNLAMRYYQGSVFTTGVEVDFINNAIGFVNATNPSQDDYNAWRANANVFGFGGDLISSTQWRGLWTGNSFGTSYALGDQVIYLGVAYQCKLNAPANAFPNTPFSPYWKTFKPSYITAEDSRLTRWQGNIWLRQTRYVLPI